MSKGLIILISGVVLLIGTLIWIYIDNKNKDAKSEELLKKINESSSKVKINSTTSINNEDETEMLDDSTEMLYDTTEQLEATEII